MAPQWTAIEIAFEVDHRSENPYLEVDGHVVFRHTSGVQLRRPLFWDGGNRFAVRFASTQSEGRSSPTGAPGVPGTAPRRTGLPARLDF